MASDGSVHSGPSDSQKPPFPDPSSKWVEAQQHFLFEANPGELEQPHENWAEKVERCNALLKEIESREGISGAWDSVFLDAASWQCPKGCDLETARVYFDRKTEWFTRMFNEPKWFHDPVHLDAVAEFFREIREWSFPAGLATYTDHPGQEILLRAGVDSPDELPSEAGRAAYRKTIEKNDRMMALKRLRGVLLRGNGLCYRIGWWHCKQALLAAEKAGDTSAVERLSEIQRKFIENAESPDQFANDAWADSPDL